MASAILSAILLMWDNELMIGKYYNYFPKFCKAFWI